MQDVRKTGQNPVFLKSDHTRLHARFHMREDVQGLFSQTEKIIMVVIFSVGVIVASFVLTHLGNSHEKLLIESGIGVTK